MKNLIYFLAILFSPIITLAQDAPDADFDCNPTLYGDTCCFSFTEQSKNEPHCWLWNFEVPLAL